MKVVIDTKKSSFNEWTIKATGFTEGMILSIVNGMEEYGQKSSVGQDVYEFFKYAYDDAKEKNK